MRQPSTRPWLLNQSRLRLALPRPTKNLMDPHWTDSGFMLALEQNGLDLTGTYELEEPALSEPVQGTVSSLYTPATVTLTV